LPSWRPVAGVSTRELVLPPNVLSLARIPLAVIFALAVTSGRSAAAVVTLAVAGATDVADGWSARHLRQETATGRVVDPAADKIFFLTAAVTTVVAGRLTVLAACLLATREILQVVLGAVLAVRGRLLAAGAATPSNPVGKMTTVLQGLAIAAALVLPDARDPLVVAAAVCGAVAAAEYWVSAVRAA
jgi:CDP-diacylglycerol--glycerol-3-phosphate 3-phosphatidyltransferase/cardiolipin synthase